MYCFADILIINFPFSNGQGSKRRPVLVIKDTMDNDILVAKVTSQPYTAKFDIALQDWKQAGLLAPSVIRVHKIQTLYTSLILGQIGRLTQVDSKSVRKSLKDLIENL